MKRVLIVFGIIVLVALLSAILTIFLGNDSPDTVRGADPKDDSRLPFQLREAGGMPAYIVRTARGESLHALGRNWGEFEKIIDYEVIESESGFVVYFAVSTESDGDKLFEGETEIYSARAIYTLEVDGGRLLFPYSNALKGEREAALGTPDGEHVKADGIVNLQRPPGVGSGFFIYRDSGGSGLLFAQKEYPVDGIGRHYIAELQGEPVFTETLFDNRARLRIGSIGSTSYSNIINFAVGAEFAAFVAIEMAEPEGAGDAVSLKYYLVTISADGEEQSTALDYIPTNVFIAGDEVWVVEDLRIPSGEEKYRLRTANRAFAAEYSEIYAVEEFRDGVVVASWAYPPPTASYALRLDIFDEGEHVRTIEDARISYFLAGGVLSYFEFTDDGKGKYLVIDGEKGEVFDSVGPLPSVECRDKPVYIAEKAGVGYIVVGTEKTELRCERVSFEAVEIGGVLYFIGSKSGRHYLYSETGLEIPLETGN